MINRNTHHVRENYSHKQTEYVKIIFKNLNIGMVTKLG